MLFVELREKWFMELMTEALGVPNEDHVIFSQISIPRYGKYVKIPRASPLDKIGIRA